MHYTRPDVIQGITGLDKQHQLIILWKEEYRKINWHRDQIQNANGFTRFTLKVSNTIKSPINVFIKSHQKMTTKFLSIFRYVYTVYQLRSPPHAVDVNELLLSKSRIGRQNQNKTYSLFHILIIIII